MTAFPKLQAFGFKKLVALSCILLSISVFVIAQTLIEGTDGDDLLYGDVGDNLIQAKKGNDTVYGKGGNDVIEGGSSIWEGIQSTYSDAVLSPDGSAAESGEFDVAVVVIGERPYAEGMGDVRGFDTVVAPMPSA